MNGRPGLELTGALAEVLRPIVADLVREELERQRHNLVLERDDGPAPYLTVAEYAVVHCSSAAAVRARIRRGSLHAIRPPGSREYLIPNDMHPEGQARLVPAKSAPAMVEHPGARHRNNGGFDAD